MLIKSAIKKRQLAVKPCVSRAVVVGLLECYDILTQDLSVV